MQQFRCWARRHQGSPAGDAAVAAAAVLRMRQACHADAPVHGNCFVQLQQGKVVVMRHIVLVQGMHVDLQLQLQRRAATSKTEQQPMTSKRTQNTQKLSNHLKLSMSHKEVSIHSIQFRLCHSSFFRITRTSSQKHRIRLCPPCCPCAQSRCPTLMTRLTTEVSLCSTSSRRFQVPAPMRRLRTSQPLRTLEMQCAAVNTHSRPISVPGDTWREVKE